MVLQSLIKLQVYWVNLFSMKLFKPKFWDKDKLNFFALILLPISLALQILIKIKNIFIISKTTSIPVICVGNIYVGGTGKTPTSIHLDMILKKLGKKGVIIKKNHFNQADERMLIQKKASSLISTKNRYLGAVQAVKEGYDLIILDDGLQDKTLFKNLNIVCFNEKQLSGNGLTLPSGPLRESLNSLKKYQIVIINSTKNDKLEKFEKKIKNISNKINIYYSKYVPDPLKIKKFNDKKVLSFAGIGSPKNFFDLLENNKLNIVRKISFPDHYNYSKNEIENLIILAKKEDLQIITTEKDYLRIKKFQFKEIDYLSVSLKIHDEDLLIKEIKKIL